MVKQDGTKTRARLAFVAQTFVQRADSPRLRPERRDAKHNQNCSDPTTRSILSLLSPRRSSSRRSCDDQYKSDRRWSNTAIRLRTDLMTSSEISAWISSSRSIDAAETIAPFGSIIADVPQKVTPSSVPTRFARLNLSISQLVNASPAVKHGRSSSGAAVTRCVLRYLPTTLPCTSMNTCAL